MKKQIVIIGLGRFGSALAARLTEKDCEVIAIDKDEEKVREIAERVSLAVVMDALDQQALRDAGVRSADIAVVSIGENVEASILAIMQLKELGVRNIIAKAVSDLHGKVLEHLGVARIIHPERDMAQRLASSILAPGILESIELSPDFSIVELEAPAFMVSRSLRETNLRARYGLSVIAIKRGEESLEMNPAPDAVVEQGDLLIVLGSNDDIERMRNRPG